MDDCRARKGCELERLAMPDGRRRVLQIVMAINALFAIESSRRRRMGAAWPGLNTP